MGTGRDETSARLTNRYRTAGAGRRISETNSRIQRANNCHGFARVTQTHAQQLSGLVCAQKWKEKYMVKVHKMSRNGFWPAGHRMATAQLLVAATIKINTVQRKGDTQQRRAWS